MPDPRLLIVDDELVVRDSLGKWFESEGYEVAIAESAHAALQRMAGDRFDCALVDIKMPGVDGIELQAKLHEIDGSMPVIIMTGYASVETAVKALKNGAYDYITKPVDPDELVHLVSNALRQSTAEKEVSRLKENLEQIFPETKLIGQSAAMRRVVELVEMVAPTDATVLITGESGTGKEVVARAIHATSPRRFNPDGGDPLRRADGDAAGERAVRAREGRVHRGAGPEEGQVRSRRRRHGISGRDQRHQPADADRPVAGAAGEGDRAGGRLDAGQGGFPRDRGDQQAAGDAGGGACLPAGSVLPAERVRDRDSAAAGAGGGHAAAGGALPEQAGGSYEPHSTATVGQRGGPADGLPWPGNVRELENAIERAMLIDRSNELTPADFPFQTRRGAPAQEITGGQRLEDIERAHIDRVLEETSWNLSKTARILDIDRTTLYNKIKRYGLREAQAN